MPARDSGKSDVEKAASSEGVKSPDPPVLCDRKKCIDYGKNARCYLDIFKLCKEYGGKSAPRNQARSWC